MFAVLRTGGKQYRVSPGDKIVVEKLDGNAGDKVTLGDILLAGDGGMMKDVKGLTVSAEIVAQGKGEKVTVFKKRRRHNYRRKKGHRQLHTILHILAIGDQKAEKKAAPAKADAKPAKAEAAPAAEASASASAEKPKAEKKAAAPKAEKAAAPKAEKPAASKAEGSESTKKAAPAKGAAEKATKTKK
ncbi:MAG TPA: 50S ribosomal protein L21 [Sphingomicrobium sp.]|nr:50S ribosomal protein L21 [Sphingomicrobium sp.]